MKNKKALLLPETSIKIIIGILVLIVLTYLGNSLFGIFKSNWEYQQAEGVMEEIELAVNDLGGKEIGESFTYDLKTPKNWYFFSYSEGIANNLGEKDVCFCKYSYDNLQSWYKTYEKCSETGVCKRLKYPLTLQNSEIKIEGIKKIRFIRGEENGEVTIDVKEIK